MGEWRRMQLNWKAKRCKSNINSLDIALISANSISLQAACQPKQLDFESDANDDEVMPSLIEDSDEEYDADRPGQWSGPEESFALGSGDGFGEPAEVNKKQDPAKKAGKKRSGGKAKAKAKAKTCETGLCGEPGDEEGDEENPKKKRHYSGKGETILLSQKIAVVKYARQVMKALFLRISTTGQPL